MRALLTKVEQAAGLDRTGDRLQRVVLSTLRPRRLRDLLHGVTLGHPLHPAMVQVPVGAWISAAVLDLMPGQRRPATVLVGLGTWVELRSRTILKARAIDERVIHLAGAHPGYLRDLPELAEQVTLICDDRSIEGV